MSGNTACAAHCSQTACYATLCQRQKSTVTTLGNRAFPGIVHDNAMKI
jgi:hypothetical protein